VSFHRTATIAEDHCDECRRPMELTGDSLCVVCARIEDERHRCICGARTIFANDFCSDACEEFDRPW